MWKSPSLRAERRAEGSLRAQARPAKPSSGKELVARPLEISLKTAARLSHGTVRTARSLIGVPLISVQEVTVRACPDREDWRGVYFDGARKCLSRLEFLLVL